MGAQGASQASAAFEEAPGLFELPSAAAVPAEAALGAHVAASSLPIGRVLLETPLPHLEREFDYLVTADLDAQATPGVRVRVPFGGRRLNGYLTARVDVPEPGVRPVPLNAVVSPEPVLSPEVLSLCREVAMRYAGTVADVVRAAVPPRVAKVEKEPRPSELDAAAVASANDVAVDEPAHPGARAGDSAAEAVPGDATGTSAEASADASILAARAEAAAQATARWAGYAGGEDFLASLAAGESPRAVMAATPDGGVGWASVLAQAAATALEAGMGSLLLVPDARDVALLCAALDELLGKLAYARLTAEDGPTPRYRAFLRLRRGEVRIAVGTRSAAFAPVHQLGLVAMWDDHDSSYVEPRAPYHHAREVLLLRASAEGTAALFASPGRSAEVQRLVRTEWAKELTAPRATLRDAAPWVRASSDDFEAARDPLLHAARLPRIAWESAKKALESGPVLVQVGRTGFLPALRCERCREPARCAKCAGPLALTTSKGDPVCRWCGTYERRFECQNCHGHVLRAASIGADRTAEELGRAFPGVPVIRSTGADGVRAVSSSAAVVIATPGAEPIADGGYAAVLLLDADAMLAPEGLRVGEDALHRWFAAASLAKPRPRGGVVILTGHPSLQGQALVRWDPAGAAERELAERAEVGLPPAVRSATLLGPAAAADHYAADVGEAAPGVRLVGPTLGEEEGEHRWILFFDHASGHRVTDLLRRRKALGSLRRDAVVQVRVDDPRAL